MATFGRNTCNVTSQFHRVAVSVLVLLFSMVYRTSSFEISYMSQNCGETVSGGTGGYIEPDTSLTYSHDMDCVVVLEVKADHKILLQFKRFDLEPPHDGVCADTLNVYDGSSVSATSLTGDLCDRQTVADVTSTGNAVTLELQTDAVGNANGFAILYTAYLESEADGSCLGEYFACNSSICIPSELKCNNYDHCGDGSDESDCREEDELIGGGLTVGQVIAIILGIICFAMLVGGIAYFVDRHQRAKQLTQEIMMTEQIMYPADNVYTDKDFWGNTRPGTSHRRSGQS
ncbi:membrane frizzled-related protein-like [Glandiceps talaboti]